MRAGSQKVMENTDDRKDIWGLKVVWFLVKRHLDVAVKDGAKV